MQIDQHTPHHEREWPAVAFGDQSPPRKMIMNCSTQQLYCATTCHTCPMMMNCLNSYTSDVWFTVLRVLRI